MMTLDDFLPRLGGKVVRTGRGYKGHCPAHEDSNPSLSISTGHDGKLLLKCFVGCSFTEILSSVGGGQIAPMKTGFLNGHKPSTNTVSARVIKTETFPYTDEHFSPLYEKRIERLSNGEKRCTWWRHTDEGKKPGLSHTRMVPFNFPALMKNTNIFFTEGEPNAADLNRLGFCATNFKEWRPEFNEYVKGCDVTVLRDHDRPGVKLADNVLNTLYGQTASLRLLDLYDREPLPTNHGRDVSDWIKNAHEIEGKEFDLVAEELSILADRAPEWHPLSDEEKSEADEDEAPIVIKAIPEPKPECFHGLSGDFVSMVLPHTEAHPMALLLLFLTYFGNIVGRSAFYRVEGTKHYCNLFTVLVGPTSAGRKGTAESRVRQVFEGIDDHHEQECRASGVSSGEGLLYRVRDETWAEKKDKKNALIIERQCVDLGVEDKRLLVSEGEFAQVLAVQGREGNTLPSYIRNLWDTGTAGSLTKNSPLKTTNAHFSLIGCITTEELLARLGDESLYNGLANRILWPFVRRSKLLPLGGDVPFESLDHFRGQLKEAIEFGKQVGEMRFTAPAKALWVKSYDTLEQSRFGFIAKVTQRASPYTLRLACIFALLDRSAEIDRNHLEAALAVWQYCEDSAVYIFGERVGDKNADTLLTALKASNDGMTRSQIRDLFYRNISSNELRRVLQFLADNDLAYFQKIRIEGGTKPREVWFAKK